MANLRDLKDRITSIKNIKQITNAMKMVAAAKLRKTQEAVVNARPYALQVNNMLRILQKKNNYTPHPLLIPTNPDGKELLIVVTADKGLCGSFNSAIIKFTMKYLEENKDCHLICIGSKGYDYFKKQSKCHIVSHHSIMADSISFENLKYIKQEIVDLYDTGQYAKVFVIYNEFKSAIAQNLTHKQIIPVVPSEDTQISMVDYIYEPDQMTIITELGTKYVNTELWRILIESSAAEQGARMTAMDNATTNAGELIEELSLLYNRERQSQITTQIIEVASGAEAINQ